jgi:hypothetical protein
MRSEKRQAIIQNLYSVEHTVFSVIDFHQKNWASILIIGRKQGLLVKFQKWTI